jgi:hypothetical protein
LNHDQQNQVEQPQAEELLTPDLRQPVAIAPEQKTQANNDHRQRDEHHAPAERLAEQPQPQSCRLHVIRGK